MSYFEMDQTDLPADIMDWATTHPPDPSSSSALPNSNHPSIQHWIMESSATTDEFPTNSHINSDNISIGRIHGNGGASSGLGEAFKIDDIAFESYNLRKRNPSQGSSGSGRNVNSNSHSNVNGSSASTLIATGGESISVMSGSGGGGSGVFPLEVSGSRSDSSSPERTGVLTRKRRKQLLSESGDQNDPLQDIFKTPTSSKRLQVELRKDNLTTTTDLTNMQNSTATLGGNIHIPQQPRQSQSATIAPHQIQIQPALHPHARRSQPHGLPTSHHNMNFLAPSGGLPPSSFVTASVDQNSEANSISSRQVYRLGSSSSSLPPPTTATGSLRSNSSEPPSIYSGRSNSPPVYLERRLGTRLSGSERRMICEYAATHSSTHEEIAVKFKIDRSTVSKILKDKEKWLNYSEETERAKAPAHVKKRIKMRRVRAPKWPELEQDLEAWGLEVYARGGRLTEDEIREKALSIASTKGPAMANFKASDGWMENFRSRSSIPFGNSSSAGSSLISDVSPSSPGGSIASLAQSKANRSGSLGIMEGIEEGYEYYDDTRPLSASTGGFFDGHSTVSVNMVEGDESNRNGTSRSSSLQIVRSISDPAMGVISHEFNPNHHRELMTLQSEDGQNLRLRHPMSQSSVGTRTPNPNLATPGNPNLSNLSKTRSTPQQQILPPTPQSMGLVRGNGGIFVPQNQASPSFSQVIHHSRNFLPKVHQYTPTSPLSTSFVNMRSVGNVGAEVLQVDPVTIQGRSQRGSLMASPTITPGISHASTSRRASVPTIPSRQRSARNANTGASTPTSTNSDSVNFTEFTQALAMVKNFLEQTPTFAPAKEMMAIAELYGKTMQMHSTMREQHQQQRQLVNQPVIHIVPSYSEDVSGLAYETEA